MKSLTDQLLTELDTSLRDDNIEKVVVGAVVVAPRTGGPNRILLLKRIADDFMGGLVELPSGGVDPGESLTNALARELNEETGISLGKMLGYAGSFDYHSSSGKRTRQFNFVGQAISRRVRLSPAEHSMFYWASRREISIGRFNISQETLAVLKEAFDALDGA